MSIFVPGLKTTLECKKGEASGKILEGGKDEITTKFTTCEIVKTPTCKVSEPLTVSTKFKMIEAGESYYPDFEALKEGSPLATIVLTGKECTLPAESKLTGAVAAEILLEEEAEQEKLKFSEAISSAANKSLKEGSEAELKLLFGKETASVSGEFVPPIREQAKRPWRPAVFTRLCSEREPRCPEFVNPPVIYDTGTEIEIENVVQNKFVYKVGANTKEPICNTSFLHGPTTSAGAAPLRAEFLVVGFFECGGGACTVEAGATPFPIRFEATGMGRGTMTILKPSFQITCEGVACVYQASRMIFKVLPGVAPELESGPQPMVKTAGSAETCSATAKWEGIAMVGGKLWYEIAPKPLYVTS